MGTTYDWCQLEGKLPVNHISLRVVRTSEVRCLHAWIMQESESTSMLTMYGHTSMHTTATSMTAAQEGGWRNWVNHESLKYLHVQADWLQHSQHATITCRHNLWYTYFWKDCKWKHRMHWL